ncbi:unnamed protein product [Cuscuta campestris]|uniref:Replication protein A 70 kDa DNA-binding subunit B/D first OB fold domain-containing protein n=1 Tax=Cuscuta campestris TaxID=132261 RepID=A0A484L122_9ASTE|nr:unnamed protein product [Cuscuta campestris]
MGMITALKNVHEKSGLLMMKLRAIRVYHVAAHSRGPEPLDVVFHDSQGDRIHAQIKDTAISTFKQALEKNAVYLIMRVKVLRNFQGTKPTNHPCMLQFLGKTKIQKLTENEFLNFRFYFKSFEDVLKTKFDDQVFLVDIIGKVVSRTALETHMVNNALEQMMEVTLENHKVSWIMKWHYTEDGTLVITQKSKRSGDCLRQIHEELRSQPCNAKGRFLAPEGRDDTERGANDAEKPDCNVGLRFQPQYIL